MADELKERLEKLVNGLLLEESVKQSLLEAIQNKAVDQKLLEKIKFFIDQAVVDYQAEADKQIAKIRDGLNITLASIDKDFEQIEKDTKEEVKIKSRENDQKEIERIRKTLNP